MTWDKQGLDITSEREFPGWIVGFNTSGDVCVTSISYFIVFTDQQVCEKRSYETHFNLLFVYG